MTPSSLVRAAFLSLFGAALVLALWLGVVGLRLHVGVAWVGLGIAVVGALLGAQSWARKHPTASSFRRAVVATLSNGLLAVLAALLLTVGLSLPRYEGSLATAQPLAEFAAPLTSTAGEPVTVESLRGDWAVLVFYRGHW